MPEEAFMKYTKDSRTVTPTQGSKPTSAKIAQVKDDQEDNQEKKVIKVDLRESVESSAKDDKAADQVAHLATPTSASTPRRPVPRGPAIQKQRGETTRLILRMYCWQTIIITLIQGR